MEYGNGVKNQLVWRENANRYHHEEEGLDLLNKNVNISILGNRIVDNSNVLDVGCGEGKLAKILSDKNCNIYGIELDDSAINYAMSKNRYRRIFKINAENIRNNTEEFEDFQALKIKFDYIVMADILEHTINPTKVLCDLSEYLADDGKILISVPNVNNADIILNLLRGKFNYIQSGILDNTHTKYFTKSSFVEWIADINQDLREYKYECEYLGGTYGYTAYLEEVKKEMPQLYQFMQINPEYNVIQILFELRKVREENLCEIYKLLNEEREDLGRVLFDLLKEGYSDRYIETIKRVRIIENERTELESRVEISQNGWKQAAKELEKAMIGWEKAEKKCNELLEGWKKANDRIEILENEKNIIMNNWKLAEAKRAEAMEGWIKCNEILELERKEGNENK